MSDGDDGGMCRLALIADTHLRGPKVQLPDVCLNVLRTADLIVHACDLVTPEVLVELAQLGAPVVAVRGNLDVPALAAVLPETRLLEVGGTRIAVLHDAGAARGRLQRLRRRFPDADAVVFGHSHVPLHETAAEGFQIFNPGSPTARRRQPQHTMGLALVSGGAVTFRLLVLEEPRASSSFPS